MWLKMYYKRLLKAPFFLFVILLFPVCAFLTSFAEKNSDEKLEVGLFFEKEEYAVPISDKLNNTSEYFNFKLYQNVDTMREDTVKGNLHCAYVFGKDFDAAKKSEKTVLCIENSNSMLSDIASEVLFAALQEIYGYNVALSYKEKKEFDKIDDDYIKDKYDYFVSSDMTYSFAYEKLEGNYSKEIKDISKEASSFPVRAVGAIIIMLSAIFGALRFNTDDEKGLHKRLAPTERFIKAFENIFSVVSIAVLSVITALLFSGQFSDIVNELTALVIYLAIAVLFGVVAVFLIGNTALITALIPILVTGTLIFCPVFVNSENFLPFIGIINKFFIPYYYLCIFNGGSILLSAAAFLVLSVAAFSLFIKESH